MLKMLIFLIMLLGISALSVSSISRDRKHLNTAIFLSMPIFCLYLLYALGLYPVSVARLMLFLVPVIIILFVYGLQVISFWVSKIVAKAINLKNSENITDTFGVLNFILISLLFLSYIVVRNPLTFFLHETMEESESAVRHLSEKVKTSDTIYVHASMREQFKLYSRLTPVSGQAVVWGNIGRPCCIRDAALEEQEDLRSILRAEMARLEFPENSGSLWLLFTDRPGHWRRGRNDPEIFERWLTRAGCFHTEAILFRGVRIDKYQCNGTGIQPIQSSLANEMS